MKNLKSDAVKVLKAEVKALKGNREQLARLGMDIVSILENITDILNCQDTGDLAEVYMDFHCVIVDEDDEE